MIKIKLYSVFALFAVASAIIALLRLGLGLDVQEVIFPNIVIGSICLVMMVLLSYKEKRQRRMES